MWPKTNIIKPYSNIRNELTLHINHVYLGKLILSFKNRVTIVRNDLYRHMWVIPDGWKYFEYNRWVHYVAWIHIIRATIATTIQSCLNRTFSRFEYPEVIVIDNALNLYSIDINQFCKRNGIQHHWSIPYHPQGISEIERFYRTLGKAITL